MDNTIVQLRKKGGLHKVKRSINGGNVNPKVYSQKHKDRDSDGNYVRDYQGSIPGTVEGISPHWDIGKNRWNWGASGKDLARLIKKMRLKHPESHAKRGQVIGAGDAEERITDFNDDVFRHKDFYGTVKMIDSRLAMKMSVARDEFLLYCYKGSRRVDDKSSDERINPYVAMDTRYELVSPKNETQKKIKNALREGSVSKYISNVFGNEPKVRAICEIMSIPKYIPTMESNAAWLVLKEFGAENYNINPRTKKSYQDQFVELMELEDGDLKIYHQITQGVNLGILRKREGHYLYNGEKVDRVPGGSDRDVIKWFMEDINQDEYLKLINILEAE